MEDLQSLNIQGSKSFVISDLYCKRILGCSRNQHLDLLNLQGVNTLNIHGSESLTMKSHQSAYQKHQTNKYPIASGCIPKNFHYFNMTSHDEMSSCLALQCPLVLSLCKLSIMAVRRFWLIAISNSEDELVAFPLGPIIRQATVLYKIDQQKMKHRWILILKHSI